MSEEKLVLGRDDVKIEYTAKSKFHKPGDKAVVHSLQADKLVKKGFAKTVK